MSNIRMQRSGLQPPADAKRWMDLTIQDLGAIGELIGSLSVLFSLIYLALRVRSNTQASSSDNETEYQVRWNAMQDDLWGTTEAADIFRRGSQDLSLLTPEEATVFGNRLGKRLDVQRIGMRMHEKGLLRDDLYEAGNNAVASYIMKTPGARQRWKVTGHFYIHREFINQLIARDQPGPMTDLMPWVAPGAEATFRGAPASREVDDG